MEVGQGRQQVSVANMAYPNEELKAVSYGSAAAIWHSLGNVKRADHSAFPINQPFGAMTCPRLRSQKSGRFRV